MSWYFVGEVSKALLTPLIALIALSVAAVQAATASRKLKLDLFKPRLDVFNALKAVLSTIVEKGAADRETVAAFYKATAEADFLFPVDVADYVREFGEKTFQLFRNKRKLESPRPMTPDERAKLFAEEDELLRWSVKQHERMLAVFGPHLNVGRFKNDDTVLGQLSGLLDEFKGITAALRRQIEKP